MSVHYLIDTDWVAHYFKGTAAIVARLDALEEGSLAISVVSLAELYEGMYGSRNPIKRQADITKFLTWVEVLGLDEEVCRRFGQERDRLRKVGNLPGDMDLLIGATALRHNVTLLTNNRRHFERLAGIRIESLPTT